ncbi:MAG: hypothetical protein V7784_07485 [Oceanospirillaceae bacterium]
MKTSILSTLLLSALTFTVNASEVDLTSKEIKKAFTGNSISGVHYKQKTVQYFSKSGLTLWMKADDKAPAEGQWKVENNQYCSDFGSGWGCYKVVSDGAQGIYYFIGKDFRAPFIVQTGYNFSF